MIHQNVCGEKKGLLSWTERKLNLKVLKLVLRIKISAFTVQSENHFRLREACTLVYRLNCNLLQLETATRSLMRRTNPHCAVSSEMEF